MMRDSMRRAGYLGAAGACLTVLGLAFAVLQGEFLAEGRRLLVMPWGRAILLDVYVGLALFCGWVFFRERSPMAAGGWTLMILATGNLATCCYLLNAVMTSGSSPGRFWMGENDES